MKKIFLFLVSFLFSSNLFAQIPVCAHPKTHELFKKYPSLKKDGKKNAKIELTKTFKVFKNILNTSEGVETITADLLQESEHFLVYRDQAETGTVTQVKINNLINAFENSTPNFTDKGIAEVATSFFGNPPDVDQNGKVILLIYDIRDSYDPQSGNSGFVAGYFSPSDQFSSPSESNFADILYLDSNPGLKSSSFEIFLGTASHEYQHLLHFGANQNQDLWLNESMSELTNYFCGYPVRGVSNFLSNTDKSLTKFQLDLGDLSDYEKVLLWGVFLYETIGSSNSSKFLELVSMPETGINAIDKLVKENNFTKNGNPITSAGDLLAYFGLANSLGKNGNNPFAYKLNVTGTNLAISPSASFAIHEALPVNEKIGSTLSLASENFRFEEGENLKVHFTGANGTKAFAIHSGQSLQVFEIPVTNGNFVYDATNLHNQNGNNVTKIVLANTNTLTTSFSYFAEGSGGSKNISYASSDGQYDFGLTDLFKVGIVAQFGTYPVKLKKISISSGGAANVKLKINEAVDNGNETFSVGSNLFLTTVNLANGTTELNFGAVVVSVDKPFFVIFEAPQKTTFNLDSTPPFKKSSYISSSSVSTLQPIQNFSFSGSNEPINANLVVNVTAEIDGNHPVSKFSVDAFLDPLDSNKLRIVSHADNPIGELSGVVTNSNSNTFLFFEKSNSNSLNFYSSSFSINSTTGNFKIYGEATPLYDLSSTETLKDSLNFTVGEILASGFVNLSTQKFSAKVFSKLNSKALLFERETGFEVVATEKLTKKIELSFDKISDGFLPAIFKEGKWEKLEFTEKNGKILAFSETSGIFALVKNSELVKNSQTFVLNQNFPNPFNPTTKISYELKNNEEAKLTIFNVLGEVVREF
ncbi:hypothetical protein IT568_11590, partial [bacterium]|nr:hypothetical protein [bacterium]